MPASRSRSAGARSRYCCSRATKSLSPSRSSAVSPSRITTASCRSRDVDLRHPLGDLRARRERAEHARGKLGARPRRSSEPPSRGDGGQAVDDRQIDVGVGRAVLVDDHAVRIDQIQSRCRGGRCPSGARSRTAISTRRRQHAAHRRALDPRRRQQPLAATRRDRTVRMFWPRRPSTSASTSPVDSRSLPRTVMCADLQRRRRGDQAPTPR